jgi:hypothetical protein
MHSCLFMAYQNVLDLVLLEQFIIDVQHRPAGIAENVFDLFFLQAPDYNLRTGHLHLVPPYKPGSRKTRNLIGKAPFGQGKSRIPAG